MGWLFSQRWSNRAEMLAHLRRPERFGESCELLRTTAVGNNHWYLARVKATGVVWIGLDLMKGGTRSQPGWGYKDLDESVGPVEVNCPLSFLDAASEPTGYAVDWRQHVRDFHAKKKARPVPVAGAVVRYGGADYLLEHPWAPRKGWAVTRVSDGARMRMKAAQLAQAEEVRA